MTIGVEDDSPAAAAYAQSVKASAGGLVNLVVILDVSGSMAGSNILPGEAGVGQPADDDQRFNRSGHGRFVFRDAAVHTNSGTIPG